MFHVILLILSQWVMVWYGVAGQWPVHKLCSVGWDWAWDTGEELFGRATSHDIDITSWVTLATLPAILSVAFLLCLFVYLFWFLLLLLRMGICRAALHCSSQSRPHQKNPQPPTSPLPRPSIRSHFASSQAHHRYIPTTLSSLSSFFAAAPNLACLLPSSCSPLYSLVALRAAAASFSSSFPPCSSSVALAPIPT